MHNHPLSPESPSSTLSISSIDNQLNQQPYSISKIMGIPGTIGPWCHGFKWVITGKINPGESDYDHAVLLSLA
ncbi:hypothetical protein L6164_022446 [Bauhinia variegata]|uniref:Uncharacterized protein n=1 Tax=Bauhinia variegata TaxID=167791 RepID=A0ACB9MF84_BAUVA|nr:hypothetical protein L6164_022446 [Bauhinia variegata]